MFIGVDPGAHGAIAALDGNGDLIELRQLRQDMRLMVEQLHEIAHDRAALVVVEAQGVFPRQSAASAAKQHRAYGVLLGALCALGSRFEIVQPQAWRRSAKLADGSGKGAAVSLAEKDADFMRLTAGWKAVDVSGAADALLIARWGLAPDRAGAAPTWLS